MSGTMPLSTTRLKPSTTRRLYESEMQVQLCVYSIGGLEGNIEATLLYI